MIKEAVKILLIILVATAALLKISSQSSKPQPTNPTNEARNEARQVAKNEVPQNKEVPQNSEKDKLPPKSAPKPPAASPAGPKSSLSQTGEQNRDRVKPPAPPAPTAQARTPEKIPIPQNSAPILNVSPRMVEINMPVLVPAAEPSQLSSDEIYARNSRAVMQIFCTTREELFSASGVIVSERGLVLTNAHVAEIVKKAGEANCQARHDNPASSFGKIKVILSLDTTLKVPDTEVPRHDVGFLQITDAVEPFNFALFSAANAVKGETLLTLGYPSEFLEGRSAIENSNLVFSTLRVEGLADIDNDPTSAEGYAFRGGLALQQGSSGTALFNREGKVVGLIFATTKKETTAEREGVALSIPYIDTILRQEAGFGLEEFIASH